MKSKIDRAKDGPGWTEVIIGVVLSVTIGVVLAAAWLMFKPVEKVRELPKELATGKVYFVAGSNASSLGEQWTNKRQKFVDGTSVDLSEDELNAAAASLAPAVDGKTKGKEAPESLIKPGPFNFHLHDGQLQIASEVQVSIGSAKEKVEVFASGGFVRRGDHFVFVPKVFYVGSCPIARLPFVPGYVLRQLWANVPVPEDLTAAWAKLQDVTIKDAQLQLVMP
ncbi:MAG: hypothetical protein ACHQ4G_04510 [Opitutales bacterium]